MIKRLNVNSIARNSESIDIYFAAPPFCFIAKNHKLGTTTTYYDLLTYTVLGKYINTENDDIWK